LATLKSRIFLTPELENQSTFHLTIDIRGSNIAYVPGDSVGILPCHSFHLVDKTLHAMRLSGRESLLFESTTISVRECLRTKVNLNKVTRSLALSIVPRLESEEQRDLLLNLLTDEEQSVEYLAQFEVWDFLEEYPHRALSCSEYIDCLLPLLPRFYSISSSQSYIQDEIHLTVNTVKYRSRSIQREGVASYFLTQLMQCGEGKIPLFVQPAPHFRLPKDPSTPMIMVGPGTGVAPFRSFLQQRLLVESSTTQHHLFFGERHSATHFYYQHDWQQMQQKGNLRVHTAFSRDQVEKIYVQDRMKEMGKELFHLLEAGAHFYVCGNATTMAKEVEKTLAEIFQMHGGLTDREAAHRVRLLRKEKRYLRDVY